MYPIDSMYSDALSNILILVLFAVFYTMFETVLVSNNPDQEVSLNIDRYRTLFLSQLQRNLSDILTCLSTPIITPPPSEPPLRTAARKYHNIKSNAAMMKFPVLSNIAALCEQVLLHSVETGLSDRAQSHILSITQALLDELPPPQEEQSLFTHRRFIDYTQDLRALLKEESEELNTNPSS